MKSVKFLILFNCVRDAKAVCDFCKENLRKYATMGPHPSKDTFYVQQGVTCNDMYMDALDDFSICEEIKRKYKVCCSGTTNATQAPQIHLKETLQPTGMYKSCNLCLSGEEPRNKNTYIHSNFVKGTCGELNMKGKSGNIPEMVCYPLQKYAIEVCGCDTINVTKELEFCSREEGFI